MVDTDTFLTILYVMADDFCKHQSQDVCAPGPKASLTKKLSQKSLLPWWEKVRMRGTVSVTLTSILSHPGKRG